MMDTTKIFMEFLDIEKSISLSLLIVTAIYVVITYFQLRESKKIRLQKETPNIVPYLKSSEDHTTLILCVKNFGEGVAKNVKVRFLEDYNRFGKSDYTLSKTGIAENGMSYFVPNYSLAFHIGRLKTIYDESINEKIKLEISYESLDNRKFKKLFELPFNQIFGQIYSSPPETYIGQIAHYLKEINSILKKMKETYEKR
ncbi:hypothetical protein CAPN008_14150 [Capnocytophaga canis]|uniref:hypothetical protein n=1 Tax=Capnocytophaga canis TaxID=1848903 RepID=UPI001ACB68B4|nr:hypothetical protein [Capnocytophaga canis]GIM61365.1 hypothetical protein CAPN008_14150 [Capnocytophaga canis]